MNLGFTQYMAIVDFLITTQRRDIEAAIREANVPLHYIDPIRSWFRDPVTINRPALLVAPPPTGITLCRKPVPEDPQPYHSSLSAYLAEERRWGRSAVESIASTSADLVSRLADPTRSPNFRIRGLVVGHIQSGKTASMTALTARSADAGYRLIIVLAGLYNDLRAQTQDRFDQEVTGYGDDPAVGPFVRHEPSVQRWSRLTRSGLRGEFDPGTHNDLNPVTPKLAVIKKNVKVLERFIAWLRQSPVPMGDLPALILDDEADQASIDSNYGKVDDDGDPIDPTKTNQRIRDLLQMLPKCTYVGFTATPFANVLIDVNEDDDLYPRDFIACLREPEGYLGPRQLFGLGMQASNLSPEPAAPPRLNVIRPITQGDQQELASVTASSDCPRVLDEALISFLLSSSCRIERGLGDKHFSMFVHPSYRTATQDDFRDVISRQVQFLRVALSRPRHFRDVATRAREIWESDFRPTTEGLGDRGPLPPFDTVWRHARTVADEIQVKTLNYNSTDTLDYPVGGPKRYVIVGGNRLSRGLTLEGLSVSVFLRDTNYYDTLLQMGRWFGYRPGYEDLTRIYVDGVMDGLFADLARVELELRHDLAKYAEGEHPLAPAAVMPLIRAHPGMLVTARNKMGAGQLRNVSLGGSPRETVSFPLDEPKFVRQNIEVARSFVQNLGRPRVSDSAEGWHVWNGVPAESVLQLIESYVFSPLAQIVNRPVLRSYIRELVRRGELHNWDVVIPRGNPSLGLHVWTDGVVTRKVRRKPTMRQSRSIGVLRDPGNIERWRSDFSRSDRDPNVGGLFLYAIDRESRDGDTETFWGDEKDDIIGLIFVFPKPQAYVPVPYVTQQALT